jgi:serine/threonine protein phosphatase PrpC
MPLEVTAQAATDIGRKRKINEDSNLVDAVLGLYAVADGMGGHAAGEVASQRAVEVVQATLAEHAEVLRAFADEPTPDRGAAAERLVEQSVQAACADIHRKAAADPRLRGMGTTFVCLVVAGRHGVVAHVGDSRLYLFRRDHVHVLTDDHTLIAEQIKAGELRPEDAAKSPFKSVLTRALGAHESVQVDTLVLEILPGDAFLLCSDGLHGYFSEDEITARLATAPGESLAADLVTTANERGGKDNITAIVVTAAETGADMPSSIARIDALQSIPLFAHLTYREQNEVVAIARTQAFPAGAMIVREGEPGGDLYVIMQGSVSIVQGGLPISSVVEGGHFGEMGLVDAAPRSASVRAIEPVRAMVIARDDLLGLMQQDPPLAVKLLWALVQVLSQRLRATNTELSDALSSGPETTRI